MPHLTVEYSSSLDFDAQSLAHVLHDAMLATSLFELGAIRVRLLRAEAFAIADLDARNAFLDMVLRIGAGRSEAEKRAAGDRIFAAAEKALAASLATPHFALSLEVREIDPGLSWKRNAIHPRLRDKEANR